MDKLVKSVLISGFIITLTSCGEEIPNGADEQRMLVENVYTEFLSSHNFMLSTAQCQLGESHRSDMKLNFYDLVDALSKGDTVTIQEYYDFVLNSGFNEELYDYEDCELYDCASILIGFEVPIDALTEFEIKYLKHQEGIVSLLGCIPEECYTGGSQSLLNMYAICGAYVDKVMRPLSNVVSKIETGISRSAFARNNCDKMAEERLALLGIDIGVQGLVALMTSGMDGVDDFALISDYATLMSIWADYQLCKGMIWN